MLMNNNHSKVIKMISDRLGTWLSFGCDNGYGNLICWCFC